MNDILRRPIQFKISGLLLASLLVCLVAAIFGLNRRYARLQTRLQKDLIRVERQQVTVSKMAEDYIRRLEALENYPPSPHAQK